MKRRTLQTAAALLAAVFLLSVPVGAVSAKSAVLMDAQTGRLLYEKNPDQRSLIASTTKIMTALVVCEQCNVLDRVRIPRQAVGIEGSSMYLKEGEILTVQELLYGLMLHSGNDAAVALAIYCGGTVEGFVDLMNDKARALGLDNTHFANPNGLDHPEHYSTARDLALLAASAMDNPLFAQTVSTKQVTVGDRYLRNHNRLLWMLPEADGVKTGYTRAAGRILVSSAVRDGRRLVAVTIHDPSDWQDHCTLLKNGFEGYQIRQITAAGQQIGTLPVQGGEVDEVPILCAEDFFYAMADGEEATVKLAGQDFVYAPVVASAEAGVAHVCIDGRPVGSIRIIYGSTVEQLPEEKKRFFQRLFGGDGP